MHFARYSPLAKLAPEINSGGRDRKHRDPHRYRRRWPQSAAGCQQSNEVPTFDFCTRYTQRRCKHCIDRLVF